MPETTKSTPYQTDGRCELCGEPILSDDAEMYDPHQSDADSVICHAECGLAKHYEVA